MATDDATQTASSLGAPAGRLTPPVWFWALLILIIAVNVGIRATEVVDHAIALVTLAITSSITVLSLLIWLATGSGYSRSWRRIPLYVVLTAIAAAAATLRIERVGGELWPEFAWRWSKHRDQLLATHSAASVANPVAFNESSERDFPQFLGPHRSAAIEGPRLGRDWSRPPKKLWSQPIGAGHSGFAIVNGLGVTIEQRDEDELTTCYDILTGQLKWSHAEHARHSTVLGGIGPRSTPTIDNGKVYVVGATGIFCCLDGRDGSVLWRKDLRQECGTNAEEEAAALYWGRAGSPLVVDDLVIVPGGGPVKGPWISLLAYDKNTGKRIWQAGAHQISYSSPALAVLGGVRQVLIVNEDSISAHDPRTGETFWEHPWPGSSTSTASSSQVVPVGGDRLFVSKGYTGGCQLFSASRDDKGKWTTKTLWRNSKLLMTKFTNVVVYDGYIYGLSDGVLECVELDTGKRRWKDGRYGHGQILRVGELLLVSTHEGGMALVELTPTERRELGQFQALDGQTWNNPALYGRYLVVRNSEEAACYELPLEK